MKLSKSNVDFMYFESSKSFLTEWVLFSSAEYTDLALLKFPSIRYFVMAKS